MSNDNDLDTLLAPARQLHYGPAYDPSPVSRYLSRTGQINPVVEARRAAEHGRYLSGFGNMSEQIASNVVERAEHQEVYDLEQEDDVLGSGIFDPYERQGTANTNTGVFVSHYSLPGYQAREIPFTTSQDVTDLTDDASIVSVPGGGMAYVEAYGKLVGPGRLGPQPPPPGLEPAPPTGRDQPYVNLTPRPIRGWDADSLLTEADCPPCDAGDTRQWPALPPAPTVPWAASAPVVKPSEQPTPIMTDIPPGKIPPVIELPPPVQVRPGYTPMKPGGPATLQASPVHQGSTRPGWQTLQPTSTPQPVRSSALVPSLGDYDPMTDPLSVGPDVPPPNPPAFPYSPQDRFQPFPPAHPQRDPFFQIKSVTPTPHYTKVPWSPAEKLVAQRSMVSPIGARIAMGQVSAATKNTAKWVGYLAAGAVAGVALRMLTRK